MMHKTFKMKKSIALLTQHGKQAIIAPLISNEFSVQLCHTDQYDTDQLGTFNNTVVRLLSPVETVLKKAYLPCEFCADKTTKLKPAACKCDACGFTQEDNNAPRSASVIFCTRCNP